MGIIDAESVDMIFADPPYNLSDDGFSVHAGKRVSVNKGKWDKSKGVEDDFDFHCKWIEGGTQFCGAHQKYLFRFFLYSV